MLSTIHRYRGFAILILLALSLALAGDSPMRARIALAGTGPTIEVPSSEWEPGLNGAALLPRGGEGLLDLDALASRGLLEGRDDLTVCLPRRRVGDEGERGSARAVRGSRAAASRRQRERRKAGDGRAEQAARWRRWPHGRSLVRADAAFYQNARLTINNSGFLASRPRAGRGGAVRPPR